MSNGEQMVEAVSGEEMAAIMRDGGFSPELTTDSQGDPLIRFKVEGFRSRVLFYGVERGKSASLQFAAGFEHPLPVEAVNEWNRTKRFGKVYLDPDGDPFIEFDLDLYGGVSAAHIEQAVSRWRSVLLRFTALLRE